MSKVYAKNKEVLKLLGNQKKNGRFVLRDESDIDSLWEPKYADLYQIIAELKPTSLLEVEFEWLGVHLINISRICPLTIINGITSNHMNIAYGNSRLQIANAELYPRVFAYTKKLEEFDEPCDVVFTTEKPTEEQFELMKKVAKRAVVTPYNYGEWLVTFVNGYENVESEDEQEDRDITEEL